MKYTIRLLVTTATAASLVACVAPRGPAAALSQAGVSATTSFAADIRATSTQLATLGPLDAFQRTWAECNSAALASTAGCQTVPPSRAVAARRLALSEAIGLRADALEALRAAYEALGREAAFDGGNSLSQATGKVVTGVNNYVSKVSTLTGTPIASVVTEPIGGVIRFAAGLIGEARQRDRILWANRQIAAALRTLRDGLAAETQEFNLIAADMIRRRADVRRLLFNSGLSLRSAAFSPLVQGLNISLVPNAEAVINGGGPDSARLRVSILAALDEASEAEVDAAKRRYRVAVQALTALIAAHEELDRQRSVSLADVVRILGQLNAALPPQS